LGYMDSENPRNTLLLPRSLDRHFEKKDLLRLQLHQQNPGLPEKNTKKQKN